MGVVSEHLGRLTTHAEVEERLMEYVILGLVILSITAHLHIRGWKK